ncbi:MAG: [NiFe]-hydrogenase assembly chaperone HybE [Rhodocyclaceae bacterium]|nr:[NiFe]-hydrogenase assembly chaperone HybE [Rhodocyclaceae bacterium]
MSARADDPAARIREYFVAVAQGPMAGLPIVNPALEVATIGFARQGEAWFGVLLTPWCMNLMLVPDPSCPCLRGEGDTQWWPFASGDYPFVVHHCHRLGCYHASSLFSPMFAFTTQAEAEAVAWQTLAQLHRPPERDAGGDAKRLSRRGFLRSVLAGGGP